ncbi:MAG TPA: hypothetical protein VHD32_17380 [Candidatus Didemnitutus sp.]|nr:hypothetical protein [Candidatus Didemnitutus sp.]
MKTKTPCVLLAVLAFGLGASLRAAGKTEYARISLAPPSSNPRDIPKDQFITLVVEGAYISYAGQPIPENDVVPYVNDLLKTKHLSTLGVYAREGAKFGDVVHAMDLLRQTEAMDVGISSVTLPFGREI